MVLLFKKAKIDEEGITKYILDVHEKLGRAKFNKFKYWNCLGWSYV